MDEFVFEEEKDLLKSEITAENLILSINVDVGQVIVDYLDENDPRQFAVSFLFRFNSVKPEQVNPFSFSFKHQVENNDLSVQIECKHKNDLNFDHLISNLNGKIHILIPRKIWKSIEILSNLNAGDFSLRLEDETINDLILKTQAGGNSVLLSNCLLTQDVHLGSKAGTIDFSLTNIQVEKPLSMIVTNQAGPINGSWNQKLTLQNKFEMITNTEVGINQLNFQGCPGIAKYDLSFKKSIGKINMNSNIADLRRFSKNSYQTDNFESKKLPIIDISMKSEIGIIDLILNEE